MELLDAENAASKLPEMRKKFALTQMQVAKEVGLTHGAYSALELGKSKGRKKTIAGLNALFIKEQGVEVVDIYPDIPINSIIVKIRAPLRMAGEELSVFAKGKAREIRENFLKNSIDTIVRTQILPPTEDEESGEMLPWFFEYEFENPSKLAQERARAKARKQRARKTPTVGCFLSYMSAYTVGRLPPQCRDTLKIFRCNTSGPIHLYLFNP